MKLTIVGSGVCANGIPGREDRLPGAYFLEWGQSGPDERVLFECPEGVRFALQKAGIEYSQIRHIAITHTHPDHCVLFPFLQAVFCKGMWDQRFENKEIFLYGPKLLHDNFRSLLKTYIPELEGSFYFQPIIRHVNMTPQYYKGEANAIGRGILTAKKVYHGNGKAKALAFRLETPDGVFAYSGDTGLCGALIEIARNADIFLCDGSARIGDNDTPEKYGHLNPYCAGDVAQRAKVKKLVLTHYTGADPDEDMIKDCQRSGFLGEIIIAKDFMVVN